MIEAEARREDGIDMVAVVTPNHLHFEVAKAALEAGLHVMSDKPATLDLAQAEPWPGSWPRRAGGTA